MDSFINMPSCCRYAWFVMHCSVVSASSSQRGLYIFISAMLCFLPSLKPVNETCYVYMVAIISSVPFVLWSVRDFCYMLCHLSRGAIHVFFVMCVVTSTSMQSRPRNISDFRDSDFCKSLSTVIFLPCKLDATGRSMRILEMFSKDVL